MLKQIAQVEYIVIDSQPPSGGCVLKRIRRHILSPVGRPAAFGRLCVETMHLLTVREDMAPAAFGRLCVETAVIASIEQAIRPAAFGRLCVETTAIGADVALAGPAAFGRLCVETGKDAWGLV